ncbi:unnamed protein product, partial [marine sediment metagenome]
HEEDKVRLKELETNYTERISNKEDLEKEIKTIKDKQEEYTKKEAEIKEKYSKDIEVLQEKLQKLAKNFKAAEQGAQVIQDEIQELEQKIKAINDSIITCNSAIGSLSKDIENIQEDTAKVKEYEKELDKENVVLRRYLVLEEAFGLEGIQTRIVKKYIPLLNMYIKEVMDVLSQGTVEESIVVNAKSKVDIDIRGGTAHIYIMLSGGEKMIVRLSTDIGLAMLSFSRCAEKPEIICLDEIFGPLDDAHANLVFDLLERLKSKFNRVLVISHKKAIN